jgi:hypothetical protein
LFFNHVCFKVLCHTFVLLVLFYILHQHECLDVLLLTCWPLFSFLDGCIELSGSF